MSEDTVGRLVSAKEAFMLTDEDLPGAEQRPEGIVASNGDALWDYRNENRINGVIVRESDRDLAVENDEMLAKAFRIHAVPKSLIFWMSPEDEESIKKYDDLLKMVSDGRAIIVNEEKQYDQSKGKFMVWIRYDEICYELHPRFSFLKEERT